jgi:hypothetical protein
MLDEAARWDDLVAGLRLMSYGAKGVPARCLVSVGPTTAAKASSEGWRLHLRPNNVTVSLNPAIPYVERQPRTGRGRWWELRVPSWLEAGRRSTMLPGSAGRFTLWRICGNG